MRGTGRWMALVWAAAVLGGCAAHRVTGPCEGGEPMARGIRIDPHQLSDPRLVFEQRGDERAEFATHATHENPPTCHVPREISDTSQPVFPKRRYFIFLP